MDPLDPLAKGYHVGTLLVGNAVVIGPTSRLGISTNVETG
jgi:hypothetical protein